MGWNIINGDCLEEIMKMPDGSVDALVTDPPFSSGTREANKTMRNSMIRSDDAKWFGSDNMSTDGFGYLIRSCAKEWRRILKDGGTALVFIDWRMQAIVSSAIESADLRKIGLIVWNKTFFGMGSGFRNQHELVLHFSKNKPSPVNRKDCGNVIDCKPIRGGVHPTEKPVELLSRMIDVVTRSGETVVDPFMGSGSTGVACVQLGRKFIGIEREAEYCDIARTRISEAERKISSKLL